MAESNLATLTSTWQRVGTFNSQIQSGKTFLGIDARLVSQSGNKSTIEARIRVNTNGTWSESNTNSYVEIDYQAGSVGTWVQLARVSQTFTIGNTGGSDGNAIWDSVQATLSHTDEGKQTLLLRARIVGAYHGYDSGWCTSNWVNLPDIQVDEHGIMYANDNGTWRKGETYVNVNGTWKQAEDIYINQNGTWKKVLV